MNRHKPALGDLTHAYPRHRDLAVEGIARTRS
jgi:hypothetical protein